MIKIALRLCLVGLLVMLANPVLSAVDIPALTWTQRSDWLNVKDAPFGAKGDGTTDDTAALQAALMAAGAPHSKSVTVYLPPGTYKITATLNWQGTTTPWKGTNGAALIGSGRETTIRWAGPVGGAMFAPNGATRSRYLGIAWDGQGTAASAYDHKSYTLYESRIRHENESFRNFTGAAIQTFGGGGREGPTPTAETMIWNCLFQYCGTGVLVGSGAYNAYQWMMVGCEFEACGNGVVCPDGKSIVCDSHFERSAKADIYCTPGLDQSVRRCTSVGSKAFFVVGAGGSASPQVVEDCRVDSWTDKNGAVQFGGRGGYMAFDCVFTHPPTASAPVHMTNSRQCPATLIVSNNHCPGLPDDKLVDPGAASTMVTVPPGKLGAGPITAQTSFLRTTVPPDGTHILDVTQPPYNVRNDNNADATAAIQKAIDDARAADNGSIVYLPHGSYVISGSLNVTGSNYKIQGSGLWTALNWKGPDDGVMLNVTSPHAIALEQFQCEANETVAAVRQTSTTPCDIVYDGLYYSKYNAYNCNGQGVELVHLPVGSRVDLNHLDAPLTVDDCGPADIFVRYAVQGRVIVKGATQPKTGFLGILIFQGGQFGKDPADWDIAVSDNQDLVIGHYYQEQGHNHLQANGSPGLPPGRITVQGVKQQAFAPDSIAVQVNNYKGRIMYGPQQFANQYPTRVTQAGADACDLVLPGDVWSMGMPLISITGGGRLVQVQNVVIMSYNPYKAVDVPDILPPDGLASVAAGLDHLRQLGGEDLKWNYPEIK